MTRSVARWTLHYLHFESGDSPRAEAQLRAIIPRLVPGPQRARALVRLARVRSYERQRDAVDLFLRAIDEASRPPRGPRSGARRRRSVPLPSSGEAGRGRRPRRPGQPVGPRPGRSRARGGGPRDADTCRGHPRAPLCRRNRASRARSPGVGRRASCDRATTLRVVRLLVVDERARRRPRDGHFADRAEPGPGRRKLARHTSSSSSAGASAWSASTGARSNERIEGQVLAQQAGQRTTVRSTASRSRPWSRPSAGRTMRPRAFDRRRGPGAGRGDRRAAGRAARALGARAPRPHAECMRGRGPMARSRGRSTHVASCSASRLRCGSSSTTSRRCSRSGASMRRASSSTGNERTRTPPGEDLGARQLRTLPRAARRSRGERLPGARCVRARLAPARAGRASARPRPNASRARRGSETREATEGGASNARARRSAIFERIGAELWAERARAELRRISGRAATPGALTPAEERVAALVAEGKTNREVAAALFLSERTVEGHLSRVFGKVGVAAPRTELAHVLGAAGREIVRFKHGGFPRFGRAVRSLASRRVVTRATGSSRRRSDDPHHLTHRSSRGCGPGPGRARPQLAGHRRAHLRRSQPGSRAPVRARRGRARGCGPPARPDLHAERTRTPQARPSSTPRWRASRASVRWPSAPTRRTERSRSARPPTVTIPVTPTLTDELWVRDRVAADRVRPRPRPPPGARVLAGDAVRHAFAPSLTRGRLLRPGKPAAAYGRPPALGLFTWAVARAAAVSEELLAPRAECPRPAPCAARAHRAAYASPDRSGPAQREALVDAGLDRRRGR